MWKDIVLDRIDTIHGDEKNEPSYDTDHNTVKIILSELITTITPFLFQKNKVLH